VHLLVQNMTVFLDNFKEANEVIENDC